MADKITRRLDLVAQQFCDRMMQDIEHYARTRAGFWLECVLAEMAPGESIEIYGPKGREKTGTERNARVLQAITATPQASLQQIASQLGVPKTTVHRIKARRRGTIGGR